MEKDNPQDEVIDLVDVVSVGAVSSDPADTEIVEAEFVEAKSISENAANYTTAPGVRTIRLTERSSGPVNAKPPKRI
ncbi:hypothetical protein LJC41_07500, partial [Desulfosarcina sp. OttesenSCG-928-G17]|nr:hypothetical protein [Desulfosarcina sp. OttesenSCG-928-G17]